MKIKLLKLRKLIRETILNEEEKEDVNFDPDSAKLNMPASLKKLLDPNISPMKFAQLDKERDASDDPKKQAIALAVFALNYADMDENEAVQLLQRAKTLAPKIADVKNEKDKTDED